MGVSSGLKKAASKVVNKLKDKNFYKDFNKKEGENK